MTEVFLDPYDIWNPKWSPLDFNSFKWLVKPTKIGQKDGEFKVAVDVAGFTGTDDKLNVEVLTENDKQLLSIQGEHVEDDGQCYTRRNLFKLYRIGGQCVAASLCVFVADDILVASLTVLDHGSSRQQSDFKQAPLLRPAAKSESQTELKKHFRTKSGGKGGQETYHVSTVSTDIKPPTERSQIQAQVSSEQFQQTPLQHQPETHVSDYVVHQQQNIAGARDAANKTFESMKGDVVKTAKPSVHFQVTSKDVSHPMQQGQQQTGVAVESSQKLTPEQFRKTFGSDYTTAQPSVPSTVGAARSDDVAHRTEAMKAGGKTSSNVHFQPAAPQPRQETSVEIQQKPVAAIANKRATGDIMKLMNRFTGQQTSGQPTVQKRTSLPTNIQQSISQNTMQQNVGQPIEAQRPSQPTGPQGLPAAQQKPSQPTEQQRIGQPTGQQSPQQKPNQQVGQQIPNQLAEQRTSTVSFVQQQTSIQPAGQQVKPLPTHESVAAERPALTTTAEYPGTCRVHQARRASVMAPLRLTADHFTPQTELTENDDNKFSTEQIDFAVKIPGTVQKTSEESGGAPQEVQEGTNEVIKQAGSFSHPYEEVEECELEQKFKDVTFASAVNANVGEQGQDVLRVTLDLSDFRSDQLAMFIVGDDIVVNVEILRLIGNSKTLTKRYTLPDNADKANVRSLLTSEGILQIDVPLLKQDRSEEAISSAPTEVIASTEF